ncbi:hypothetical protein [Dongia deserti]|uniref:hypothetical protein n=1 Tax=Dongia deserti TaxID=2268030 RepID=UPI0013C47CC2|nr:hypothetical protein [Dongia deserti]
MDTIDRAPVWRMPPSAATSRSFSQTRAGEGLERIASLVLELGGLPSRRMQFARDLPPLTEWRQV